MAEPDLLARQRRVVRASRELEPEPTRRQRQRNKLTQEARQACHAKAERRRDEAAVRLQEALYALRNAEKSLGQARLKQLLPGSLPEPAPKRETNGFALLERGAAAARRAASEIERLTAALQRKRESRERQRRREPELVRGAQEEKARLAREREWKKTQAEALRRKVLAAFLVVPLVLWSVSSLARRPRDEVAGVSAAQIAGTGLPERSHMMAFVSNRDGSAEIYVMNDDGSSQANLTLGPDEDAHPVWSPDGRKIAFLSRRHCGLRQTYVMNADGSGQTPRQPDPCEIVLQDNDEHHPCWSPDGKRIAFSRFLDDPHRDSVEVLVVKVEDWKIRRLTEEPGWSTGISWSPDGKRIAFDSGNTILLISDWKVVADPEYEGDSEIFVMNRNGFGRRNLAPHPADDWYPVWSPTRDSIAFLSERDGNQEIYVMAADGSQLPT